MIARRRKQAVGTLIIAKHVGMNLTHLRLIGGKPSLRTLQEFSALSRLADFRDKINRYFRGIALYVETDNTDRKTFALANEQQLVRSMQ